LGQPLVIPIILRTLASTAGTITFDEEQKLPMLPDSSFLSTLDTGERQVITRFELVWWSGRKPRDINTVDILNASTLRKCLEHYRQEKKNSITIPVGSGAGLRSEKSSSNAGVRTFAGAETSSFAGTSSLPGTSSFADTSSVYSPVMYPLTSVNDAGCRKCANYRQLLSDVLQDVLKFQKFASLMSTSSENLLNIGIRRTSVFNLLHEQAIMKETSGIPPLAKAPTSHHISAVIQNATTEFNRLKDLPPSSYKWTWGKNLSEKDVLNLGRTGTDPGADAHSGYDISNLEGRPAGEYSSVNSTNFSTPLDDPPAKSSVMPYTRLRLPKHFSRVNYQMIYDPYERSNSSISPVVQVTDNTLSGTGTTSKPFSISMEEVLKSWQDDVSEGEVHLSTSQPLVSPPSNAPTSAQESQKILQMSEEWDGGDEADGFLAHTSASAPTPAPAPAPAAPPSNAPTSARHSQKILQMSEDWDGGDEADGFLAHPSASAPTPAPAPAPATAPAVQILPLVDIWETDSDDAHHADVSDKDLPASPQAPAGQSHHIHHVIDLWDSEDSENVLDRGQAHVPAPAQSSAPSLAQAPAVQSRNIHHIIDLWDSDDSEKDNHTGNDADVSDNDRNLLNPALQDAHHFVPASAPVSTKSSNADISHLVDAWVNECYIEENVPVSTQRMHSAQIPASVSNAIQTIADGWKDEDIEQEHSGDELASPLYVPLALGDVMSEDADVEEPPALPASDWQYGPDDFSFLQNDMFDLSDD
jgi:hypothetical protein